MSTLSDRVSEIFSRTDFARIKIEGDSDPIYRNVMGEVFKLLDAAKLEVLAVIAEDEKRLVGGFTPEDIAEFNADS